MNCLRRRVSSPALAAAAGHVKTRSMRLSTLSPEAGLYNPSPQRENISAAGGTLNNARLCPLPHVQIMNLNRRSFSFTSRVYGLSEQDIKRQIEEITHKFMEAREMIEDTKDVKDTVYFSEEMNEACEAVTETLNMYQNLINQLNEEQRKNVVRSIGLKMEELKAQKQMLEEEAKHQDH